MLFRSAAPLLVLVLATIGAFAPRAALAAARPAISLAPHRAVYDLSFAGSADGRTVSASGRMTFEVLDACSAWATQQMLQISSVDRDGTETATRSDYATWEQKDGRAFNFTVLERDNGEAADTVRGHAAIAPGTPGHVVFSEPHGTTLTLPVGTLFPMAHTAAILNAAAAGTGALSPLLFDGTGTDGAEYTHVTVLGWGPTSGTVPAPSLAALPSGRIHIAFYPLASTAPLPEYEIGARYFGNGVSDRLEMDFGSFRLDGALRSLTLLPMARDCRR